MVGKCVCARVCVSEMSLIVLMEAFKKIGLHTEAPWVI